MAHCLRTLVVAADNQAQVLSFTTYCFGWFSQGLKGSWRKCRCLFHRNDDWEKFVGDSRERTAFNGWIWSFDLQLIWWGLRTSYVFASSLGSRRSERILVGCLFVGIFSMSQDHVIGRRRVKFTNKNLPSHWTYMGSATSSGCSKSQPLRAQQGHLEVGERAVSLSGSNTNQETGEVRQILSIPPPFPACFGSSLEPFWKSPVFQANALTEGPAVRHMGSGGRSGHPSLQMLCITSFTITVTTEDLHHPIKHQLLDIE